MAVGEWYYARNNQQQGPVALQALQDMARSGQLQPGDLVWRDGLPNWLPASRVPELFAQQAAPAYAPPPAGVPSPYAQPGYFPQVPRYHADVPSYLTQAILATLFCCQPFGIVAIVYAAQVSNKMTSGDYNGAVDSSQKAKTWCWVAFGAGLLLCGGGFLMSLISAGMQQ